MNAVWIAKILAAAAVLCVLFGTWIGVHLLAQRRLGYRKLSCSGPVVDEEGKARCCKGTGELCDDPGRHHIG